MDLLYSQFARLLSNLAIKLKLNVHRYRPHTCRKGGTTDMHICGADMQQIQQFGKWEDINFLKTYIQENNPDLIKFIDQ